MKATRPPFLVQVLAVLLTFYAMAGVWLAMTMAGDRDPRFHWLPLAIGGAAFAISAGVGALAVWRQEPRGPLTLIACAIIGATLCGAMPFAVRDTVVSRDTRLVSIAGGLLFAAFLVLAARFIRLSLRSRKS
jgi:hypothetical protein